MPSKYPRTPHLPWSPGATADDTRAADVSIFEGREVVVTEKMDGECTTIYQNGKCHARSVDSGPHPSRERVKALAAEVGHRLTEDRCIVGENVYAKHSIGYSELPAHFLVFGVHLLHEEQAVTVASWRHVEAWCRDLGLAHVPVLYRGPWDEAKVRACWTGRSRCGGEQEGYVVRFAGSFTVELFPRFVMKYVRDKHVQTDEHWMHKTVVPNRLGGSRT